jgi:hypothetical protein
MAKRTKKATGKGEALARVASKTYTEAEVAAMLAKAFADGKASRRGSLPKDAGFHAVDTLTESEVNSNMVGKCCFNTGKEQFIGSAFAREDGKYRVGIKAGNAFVPGFSIIIPKNAKPGQLTAMLTRAAKEAGAEMEAYLTAEVAKTRHVFRPKKKGDE